jgi:hypothetical protein
MLFNFLKKSILNPPIYIYYVKSIPTAAPSVTYKHQLWQMSRARMLHAQIFIDFLTEFLHGFSFKNEFKNRLLLYFSSFIEKILIKTHRALILSFKI